VRYQKYDYSKHIMPPACRLPQIMSPTG
jgi:hypothetical protein